MTSNNLRKIQQILFDKYSYGKIQHLDIDSFENVGENAYQKILKTRRIKYRKAWLWDQYLQKQKHDFCIFYVQLKELEIKLISIFK